MLNVLLHNKSIDLLIDGEVLGLTLEDQVELARRSSRGLYQV